MTETIKVDDMEITPYPEGWLKPIHPALGVIDETAYVGFWIPSKVRNKEGHETEELMLYLITDKRERILANDEALRSRGWRLQYKPVHFENRWTMSDVEAYLHDGKGLDLGPIDLFKGVLEAWRTYIWFEDDREYAYEALWDIGTYFHHLFNAYPYPYFGGVKRSAKTKALTVHSCLAFNAIFSMNVSTACLFRMIQNARCSFMIDESERLNNPERAQEFRSLLLGGYKRGECAYRNVETREKQWTPTAFEVYSPKALANISGLEGVLEDRCKTTIMRRTLDRAIVDREIDEEDPCWAALRASLYRFYLGHWRGVKGLYNDLGALSGLSELAGFLKTRAPKVSDEDLGLLTSRELELWRPILALALYIDEAYQAGPTSLTTQIIGLAIDTARSRGTEDATESADMILVGVLAEIVKEDAYYMTGPILDAMRAKWDKEETWLNSKWLGKALRRLGFRDKKRKSAGVQYNLKMSEVVELARIMGVELPSVVSVVNAVSGQPKLLQPHAEIIEALRASIDRGSMEDFMRAMGKLGLSPNEANGLFSRLLKDGKLVEGPEGAYHWLDARVPDREYADKV
jgi:hypothetical protein